MKEKRTYFKKPFDLDIRDCYYLYSQLSLDGHLYKTDTPLKRTSRVSP